MEENRALSPKLRMLHVPEGGVTAVSHQRWYGALESLGHCPETPRVTGKTKDGVTTWGPAGAGIWSAPTIDEKRRVLYVGTGNDYSTLPGVESTVYSDAILAIDLQTGKIAWSSQVTPGDVFNGGCSTAKNCPGPDYDFGASVIIGKLRRTEKTSCLRVRNRDLSTALIPTRKAR